MHRTHALLILFSISFLIGPRSACAQQDTTAASVRITLLDGTTYTGVVVQEDEDAVRLRTTAGAEITIPKAQIKARQALTSEVAGGRFTRLDPNRTRLLVAPTARPLKAGQGYFADYEIFLPFVAVGVTDRISIGGGISIVPGDIEQLLYLTPKVTVFTTKHVGAAVGVLYGTTTRFEGDGGGLVYGIGTFGSPVHALTAGVGFAFGNGGLYKRPVFLLGGESQVANSIKLISENYFVLGFEGDVVVSGAVRFFGDRLAADLGLVTSFEAAKHIRGWPFAPLVSFAYNFGRN